VQSCLFLKAEQVGQNVHNIVVVEENSELHILTGCSVAHGKTTGAHFGISEFYVKKGGKLTFTMVHNWGSSLAKESHDLLEHLGTGRAQEVFEAKSSHEEAVRILDWALEQLSPEDRMVVTLTSLEEKSVAEAAELLGWTKVNVKVRAHRARKKLKTIIEQAN
jgi:RNA polymerase sigma factor (sigma-70 family)